MNTVKKKPTHTSGSLGKRPDHSPKGRSLFSDELGSQGAQFVKWHHRTSNASFGKLDVLAQLIVQQLLIRTFITHVVQQVQGYSTAWLGDQRSVAPACVCYLLLHRPLGSPSPGQPPSNFSTISFARPGERKKNMVVSTSLSPGNWATQVIAQ